MDLLYELQERNFDFLESVADLDNENDRENLIFEFIEATQKKSNVSVPEFPKDSEWFNVENPLSQSAELKGKIQVLDFFTYCCINCMHILPDLEALEAKFADINGVVIIGVHSAKFENEKLSQNILSAVLRYNIAHPVVNDDAASLWHSLNIQCWPTLVITGPEGQILCFLAGEGHRNLLIEFVSVALEYYKKDISTTALSITLAKESLPKNNSLLFPGKLAVSPDGEQLAVADTGHHRVVIANIQGIVQTTIGGPNLGLQDGNFSSCKFNGVQGICWSHDSNNLFVADTNNHAIRKIDLRTERVVTLAGTGVQGQDHEGGQSGPQQPISSPWDLALVAPDEKVLLLAMAGTHQIWALFLEDSSWINLSEHVAGTCLRVAGSGQEENKNGPYPHKAGFAQPSGIALGKVKASDEIWTAFVADSESSSLRTFSLKDGAVKALVGGDIDPKNLFSFGDVDGKKTEAKLQHPLAVVMRSKENGPLLVADSYNHKVKVVDVLKRDCRTLFGSGKPGNVSGSVLGDVQLNEPGGLSVDPEGRNLFIADTNNHVVKIFDFEAESLRELPIVFPNKASDATDNTQDSGSKSVKHIAPRNAAKILLDPVTVACDIELNVQLDVALPPGHHLTDGAPSRWKLFTEAPWIVPIVSHPSEGTIQEGGSQRLTTLRIRGNAAEPSRSGRDSLNNDVSMESPVAASRTQAGSRTPDPKSGINHEGAEDVHGSLDVECVLYYCNDGGACKMKGLVFNVPITATSGLGAGSRHQGNTREDAVSCVLKHVLDS